MGVLGEGRNEAIDILNAAPAVVAKGKGAVAAVLVWLPSLGLKHSNRANAFCLADDLIEPLRPIVDYRVRELVHNGCNTLDPPTKAEPASLVADAIVDALAAGKFHAFPDTMAKQIGHAYESFAANVVEAEMAEV